MTPLKWTQYLLASTAILLTVMFIVVIAGRLTSPAHAGQAVNQPEMSIVTARALNRVDAVYVLDNASGRLLVYAVDVDRRQISMLANEDITQFFGDEDEQRRSR